MKNLLLILLAFGLFLSLGVDVQARKSDPFVPIVESDPFVPIVESDPFVPVKPSDCVGLDCAAYGICDTYCEDLECDTKEGFEKNPEICEKVLSKYQEKTGFPGPPCDCNNVCFDEQVECKSECKPGDLECFADCCSSFADCQIDCCEQVGDKECVTDFCAIGPN